MLVEGRYLVEVRLNGYTNPTGRCGHGAGCETDTPGEFHCCDIVKFDTMPAQCDGGERCDSYFFIA